MSRASTCRPGVHPAAAVAHRLYPSVRQPLARVLGRQQHPAYRRPQRALPVVLEELQLRQRDLGRLVGPRARILPPQLRPQAVDAAVPHHLRVGRHGVRLPARLREPAHLHRIHLPLLVPPAAEVPARRPMHGRALGHLDDQRPAPRRLRRRHPEQTEVERRLHAVRTDLRHEVGQRIQLRRVEPLRPPLVGHAQHEPSSATVGARRELVRQIVPPRTDNPQTAEPSLLQLETRVFTERDLLPQTCGVD